MKQANVLGMAVVLVGFLTTLTEESLGQATAPLVENFDRAQTGLPNGWRVVSGDWQVREGALVADSLKSEAYITFGESSWQNYEVEASVTFRKVRNSSRWLSLLVRATPNGAPPWSHVSIRFATTTGNGTEFAVRTPENKWSVRRTAPASSASKLNHPRRLKVIVRGASVEGYLDEQVLTRFTSPWEDRLRRLASVGFPMESFRANS